MFKTACIGCQWVKHVVGFDFRSGLKTSWACFFFLILSSLKQAASKKMKFADFFSLLVIIQPWDHVVRN